MLRKYQSTIIDINESHISSFVKLSTFLKNKREGIQSLFISLDNVKNEVKLEIRSEILQSSIQSYRVVLFHSINMITSIVKKDLITFHEIYESLDNLRIFDSKFERDMTRNMGKLNSGISEINTNLEKVNQNLMNLNNQMNSLEKSINNMESNIISELSSLSYVTQNSIEELGNIVQNELSEIDSTLKWNNMLTGIQTYQMYKINKNTKNLRG
jgi:predicted nuclease with TOPRIM domain